jgi:hypothetical protein
MSNKPSTSNQVISLPKGRGALQGIGEKFLPDLHAETGNFTILIALPQTVATRGRESEECSCPSP